MGLGTAFTLARDILALHPPKSCDIFTWTSSHARSRPYTKTTNKMIAARNDTIDAVGLVQDKISAPIFFRGSLSCLDTRPFVASERGDHEEVLGV